MITRWARQNHVQKVLAKCLVFRVAEDAFRSRIPFQHSNVVIEFNISQWQPFDGQSSQVIAEFAVYLTDVWGGHRTSCRTGRELFTENLTISAQQVEYQLSPGL